MRLTDLNDAILPLPEWNISKEFLSKKEARALMSEILCRICSMVLKNSPDFDPVFMMDLMDILIRFAIYFDSDKAKEYKLPATEWIRDDKLRFFSSSTVRESQARSIVFHAEKLFSYHLITENEYKFLVNLSDSCTVTLRIN